MLRFGRTPRSSAGAVVRPVVAFERLRDHASEHSIPPWIESGGTSPLAQADVSTRRRTHRASATTGCESPFGRSRLDRRSPRVETLRHSDVSGRVPVSAAEFALSPTSAGRDQADLAHLRGLSERDLAARHRHFRTRNPRLVIVGLATSSTNQREQPIVDHVVVDVAHGARLRPKPGNDVAVEDPARLRCAVEGRPSEIIIGGGHSVRATEAMS